METFTSKTQVSFNNFLADYQNTEETSQTFGFINSYHSFIKQVAVQKCRTELEEMKKHFESRLTSNGEQMVPKNGTERELEDAIQAKNICFKPLLDSYFLISAKFAATQFINNASLNVCVGFCDKSYKEHRKSMILETCILDCFDKIKENNERIASAFDVLLVNEVKEVKQMKV